MSSTRAQLVANLEALDALPDDIDVVAYSRKVTALERVTLFVRVDEVRNSKNARGWRDFDITLILATPKTDPLGPADDELDAALEDVLDLLDSRDAGDIGVTWARATRAVLDDAFPAYEISSTVTSQRRETP